MASFDETATAEQVTEGIDLSGRTYLVTGCNSGLGFETMRVLVARGARVVGSARTDAKAAEACAKIDGSTKPIACELSDPDSVRAAVQAIDEPLHGIIANAGVMALPELVMQHGVEAHMYTNHVGHFILVTGLLDRLTADGRVVMLSSGAHAYSKGAVDDLSWTGPYDPWTAYGRSKLANILFAMELAKRLPAGQTANSVHPGVIETPLWRHMPEDASGQILSNMTLKTIPQGAATQVFVATHPHVAKLTGKYFADCNMKKGSESARDEALAARLWQATGALVG